MENFEDKVKSMKASEIVQAMIDSLKEPVYKIDMDTFGMTFEGVCYGCAATNTIAKISGEFVEFNCDKNSYVQWSDKLKVGSDFLWNFEMAIDYLRSGDLLYYAKYAEKAGFGTLPLAIWESQSGPDYSRLPVLTSVSYLKNLHHYEALVEALKLAEAEEAKEAEETEQEGVSNET